MSAVVSDTSPINYLIRIGAIEILPQLFGEIIIPPAVWRELQHSHAPSSVQAWAVALPAWATVRKPVHLDETLDLGAGETEAISLAKEMGDVLLLIDERKGRREAIARGIPTASTISILAAGDDSGLINIEEAVANLRTTNFYINEEVLAALLNDIRSRRKS